MQVPHAKLDSWIRRYGASSNSYVLLEGAKSYFTSPGVDGFLAYQVSAGVALIAGDPVCAPQQARRLIRDFTSAMMRPVGAYQVSPLMLAAFRQEGFADVQIAALPPVAHPERLAAARGLLSADFESVYLSGDGDLLYPLRDALAPATVRMECFFNNPQKKSA